MSLLALAAMLSLCAFPFVSSQATHAVTVSDYAFTPNSFNAAVGDTVTWTLVGTQAPHTVTQGSSCAPATNGFDSGPLSSGGAYSHVLNTAGTVNYYCTYHCSNQQMFATITVAASNTTTTTTTTTAAPTTVATTTTTAYVPVGHTVNVGNYYFSPASLTVTVGDSVTFHLTAGTHNVLSTTGASTCNQATNPLINQAATLAADYTVTFNQTGTYPYMCAYHCTSSQMYGVINVVAPGNPTTPKPSGAMSNQAQSAAAAVIAAALAIGAIMRM